MRSVMRWRLLIVATVFISLLITPVLAAGRAGTRFELGTNGRFTVRVYAEQIMFRIGDVEVTGGVDVRLPEGLVTPYTAFNVYSGRYWASLEVASDIGMAANMDVAFKLVFMFGLIW